MVYDLANFGFQVIEGGNDVLHTVNGVGHILDGSRNLVKNKVNALKRLLNGKTSSAKEAVVLVLVFNLCNALFHKRPDVGDRAHKTIVRVQDGLRCSGKRVNRRFEAVGDILARLSNSVDALCEVAQVGFHLLEPTTKAVVSGAHRTFQRVCGFHHGFTACVNGKADRTIAQTVVVVCQLRTDGLYRIRHGLDGVHRKVFGSGDTVGQTFVDKFANGVEYFRRRMDAKSVLETLNKTICQFTGFVRNKVHSIFHAVVKAIYYVLTKRFKPFWDAFKKAHKAIYDFWDNFACFLNHSVCPIRNRLICTVNGRRNFSGNFHKEADCIRDNLRDFSRNSVIKVFCPPNQRSYCIAKSVPDFPRKLRKPADNGIDNVADFSWDAFDCRDNGSSPPTFQITPFFHNS